MYNILYYILNNIYYILWFGWGWGITTEEQSEIIIMKLLKLLRCREKGGNETGLKLNTWVWGKNSKHYTNFSIKDALVLPANPAVWSEAS